MILGEQIDILLNTPVGRIDVQNALRDCMAEQGYAVTQGQLGQALNALMGPPGPPLGQIEPYQIVGTVSETGLVKQALNQIAGEDVGGAVSQSDPLEASWSSPVESGGRRYEGGCLEMADKVRAKLPAGELQAHLSAAYVDEVGQRFFADQRIIDMHAQWSACMMANGFGPYSRPGDQLIDVGERVDRAREDIQKLRVVQEFDRSVTAAAGECSDGLETQRFEIREEYERRFFERHSLEIAELADVYATGL